MRWNTHKFEAPQFKKRKIHFSVCFRHEIFEIAGQPPIYLFTSSPLHACVTYAAHAQQCRQIVVCTLTDTAEHGHLKKKKKKLTGEVAKAIQSSEPTAV